MKTTEVEHNDMFVDDFKRNFKPQPGFEGNYKIGIEEMAKPLIIKVDGAKLDVFYGNMDEADVTIQISEDVLGGIIAGRMTFQRAFMGGDMTMKGDFRILRTLDQIFTFSA